MTKLLFWLCGTVASICIALIPETIMFISYKIIAPESENGRIAVMFIFWFFGAGASILFAFLGFFMFAAITAAVMKL
jgi:hypothetical protein